LFRIQGGTIEAFSSQAFVVRLINKHLPVKYLQLCILFCILS
jgi:hypothetical protein